jgi:hypothetical protein
MPDSENDGAPSPIVDTRTVDYNCECCKCGLLSVVIEFDNGCRCLGIYSKEDCSGDWWEKECHYGPSHFEVEVSLLYWDSEPPPGTDPVSAREVVFFEFDAAHTRSSGYLSYSSHEQIPVCSPGKYKVELRIYGDGMSVTFEKVITLSSIYGQTVVLKYRNMEYHGCCNPTLTISLYDLCRSRKTPDGDEIADDLKDFDDVVVTMEDGTQYTLTYDPDDSYTYYYKDFDLPCGSSSGGSVESVTIGGEEVSLYWGDFYFNPSQPYNASEWHEDCNWYLMLRLPPRYYLYLSMEGNECTSVGDTMTLYVKDCDYGSWHMTGVTLSKVPGSSSFVYFDRVPLEHFNLTSCDCRSLDVYLDQGGNTLVGHADFHDEYNGVRSVFVLTGSVDNIKLRRIVVTANEKEDHITEPYTITVHVSYYDGYSTQYFTCTLSNQGGSGGSGSSGSSGSGSGGIGPGAGCSTVVCMETYSCGVDYIDAPPFIYADSNTSFPSDDLVQIDIGIYYTGPYYRGLQEPEPVVKLLEAPKSDVDDVFSEGVVEESEKGEK